MGRFNLMTILAFAAAGCGVEAGALPKVGSSQQALRPSDDARDRADTFADPTGALGTFVQGGGTVDHSNEFFQSLGTNGRSCASCHVES
ncbi:MAG: hypothetical protein ACYCWW_10460, partial [Deltaproteobacteria bacterium]